MELEVMVSQVESHTQDHTLFIL